MTPQDRRAWALFVDWCEATGAQPLPASSSTVAAFVAQVTARPATVLDRVRAIRRAHVRAGHLVPLLGQARRDNRGPTRRGASWLGVDEALARCPTMGGTGVRGRRDALVLVLHQRLGLTANRVARLRTDDLDLIEWRVAGHDIMRSLPPAHCARCVFARWIDVHRALVPNASRGAAQHVVLTRVTEQHRCSQPVELPHPGAPLLIGLDRHGWPAGAEISTRTVARVGARRMVMRATALPTYPAPPAHVDAARLKTELDDLLTRLEAVADQIGEVQESLARTTAWTGRGSTNPGDSR